MIPKINFKYSENPYYVVWIKILIPFVKKILTKRSNFFLKINDVISQRPLIDGTYEPHLRELYSSLSRDGFNDFYIDIGANVGLSSILVGYEFKLLYLFEPNPLIFKILEVNASLNLDKDRYQLFNYGLGNLNDNLEIMIPKNNWGGAFIVSKDNHYEESLLASKDGFSSLKSCNYIKLNAKIKKTSTEIKKIFTNIYQKEGRNGIIKIDVEGFEEVVLKGIASAIPGDSSVVIIFENWNEKFNINEVTDSFNNRASAFKVNRDSKKHWPALIKNLFLLFGGKYLYSLKKIEEVSSLTGDLVLYIKKID